MISFRIHEDENVGVVKKSGKTSNDNDPQPKNVLRCYNTRLNSMRCPLVPMMTNALSKDVVSKHANPGQNDKRKPVNLANDDDLLDKACLLIKSQYPNVKDETPGSEHDDSTQDMSVDFGYSAEMIHAVDDEEMDRLLYEEPKYRKHIYEYLLEAEHHHRPHPMYMKKQTELNNNMRCILIDWLVSISDEYNLTPTTLYMAVSYIDRFLSKMSVVRSKFQLLGVSAMMIAAKYEEVHPPDIYEFSSLTKDTCSVKQILKMEELILRVLSFDLSAPTVQTFIEEYSVQARASKDLMYLAMYISELCLVDDVHFISYLPSEVAASSLALSRHTLNEDDMWPIGVEEICNYSLSSLYPIVRLQHKVLQDSPKKTLQAVRTKYSRVEFKNVAKYVPRKLM